MSLLLCHPHEVVALCSAVPVHCWPCTFRNLWPRITQSKSASCLIPPLPSPPPGSLKKTKGYVFLDFHPHAHILMASYTPVLSFNALAKCSVLRNADQYGGAHGSLLKNQVHLTKFWSQMNVSCTRVLWRFICFHFMFDFLVSTEDIRSSGSGRTCRWL